MLQLAAIGRNEWPDLSGRAAGLVKVGLTREARCPRQTSLGVVFVHYSYSQELVYVTRFNSCRLFSSLFSQACQGSTTVIRNTVHSFFPGLQATYLLLRSTKWHTVSNRQDMYLTAKPASLAVSCLEVFKRLFKQLLGCILVLIFFNTCSIG